MGKNCLADIFLPGGKEMRGPGLGVVTEPLLNLASFLAGRMGALLALLFRHRWIRSDKPYRVMCRVFFRIRAGVKGTALIRPKDQSITFVKQVTE